MNGRIATSLATLFVIVLVTASALAQGAAPRPAAPPAAAPAIATVGGRAIPRAELDARARQALDDYRQRRGQAVPPEMVDLVRRQVLEGLIRTQLVQLDAQRQGILGTVADAEAEIRKLPFLNPDGKFDAARFEALKTRDPKQYALALQQVREQLGARILATRLESRYSPDPAEVRASARRSLSHATVDALMLRSGEFSGAYAEPREADVLAAYRAHQDDYRRPDRASLTIAFVNSPPLSDSAKRSGDAVAAWTDRMRFVADSITAAVRAGGSLDSVAAFLGPRSAIVVERDNFPGYWKGTLEQANQVFQPSAAGHVLAAPVRAQEGWLVVRVDEVVPAHLAPFRDVSREIRATLRRDRRVHAEENAERALYAELRDSLAAPGWSFRYAGVDTAVMTVAEPSDADIDRYYRGHQADYASFDTQTGGIVTRPLAEVRGEVRLRLLRERRVAEARRVAETLLRTWMAGGRDAALEAKVGARLSPFVTEGSDLDTTAIARAIADTLWKIGRIDPSGGAMVATRRGWLVWYQVGKQDGVVPTFEQARRELGARVVARQDAADLAGGRALWEQDPMRFNKGNLLHFTRITFMPQDEMTVPLTRPEVEKWYHDHIERYSAAEVIAARHILIQPKARGAAADREALATAKEILRRLQAGEDFTRLAQAYSEDPATRDAGGDLGTFGRGTMLEPIERAAFTMQPGTLASEPIKTEIGYHLLRVDRHDPPLVRPLNLVYVAVASDAALDKSARMATQRADSLLRAVRDSRRLPDAARRAGAEVFVYTQPATEPIVNPDTREFFEALRVAKPGTVLPKAYPVKGLGTWIGVVDSLSPPGQPTWDQARNDAVAQYRREAGARALAAKRAELDSLAAAGASLDSLGAYWGGLQHVEDLALGHGLPYLGNSEAFDSLMFGGVRGSAPLAERTSSPWLSLPNGWARVRVEQRREPTAAQLDDRTTSVRSMMLEERMRGYIEDLRSRYPVRILDPKLRDLSLFGPGGRANP